MATKLTSRAGASLRSAYGDLDAAGVTNDIILVNKFDASIAVAVHPEASSSMKVEYTLSSRADIAANTAKWFNWVPGTVAAATHALLESAVTAIRVTQVTGTGSYEIVL